MLSVQEERSAHLFSKREIRGDLGESNFNGVNLVRIKLLVTWKMKWQKRIGFSGYRKQFQRAWLWKKWEGIIANIGYEVECVETYGKDIKREKNLQRKEKSIDRAQDEAKKNGLQSML